MDYRSRNGKENEYVSSPIVGTVQFIQVIAFLFQLGKIFSPRFRSLNYGIKLSKIMNLATIKVNVKLSLLTGREGL
jgi:hypothetical protein